MKQSIIKKIICAVLAATLIFGAAPAAIAAAPVAVVEQSAANAEDSNEFVVLADETGKEDGDIRDDPTFQEAMVEIVKSFVKSFAETIVRYVKVIIDYINSQISQQ